MNAIITLCPHGISHQPGDPAIGGRSVWCGECFDQCDICGELVYTDTDGDTLPFLICETDGHPHTCKAA
jgi:hypothetical protein